MPNRRESKKLGFWKFASASLIFRLILACFSGNLNLSSRPEVSTPVTSLRRLAEGYWLKQLSVSPYQGSMYHGSPLLLRILGPLTVKRIDGLPNHLLFSLVFVIADFISAILIRATGRMLESSHVHKLKSLGLEKLFQDKDILPSGDIAALVYLWNPFTMVTCVGFNTSPIDNMFVILSLYGASAGLPPLAAFGWVVATHLSLYPVVLVVPVIFLLGYGLDAPPRKLFLLSNSQVDEKPTEHGVHKTLLIKATETSSFRWRRVIFFIFWACIWITYVLFLCAGSVREYGGLGEMFNRTYGFILTVKDLSPNIGVMWYFFAEVFDFFRKMKFSFFLFCGYVGISLLSPVMHNLWIWRGTGNANFYFATAMAYACFQVFDEPIIIFHNVHRISGLMVLFVQH
ncbi:phosphatidylinositol glycan anchor biosynthesis class U protein [Dorcoceras hygrometricum]|uniref:Phosphatidylinositol glycan anchor biosynthesis class U protein n=1 Tax=Dorcoceras hygrometricum TaxID=472368 RepID=A0A2Z7D0L6_9LAMI|nr:phosphatidylinositol glycan anchor biosynthesis class U protein [Dorcoceras hygrometricum]